YLRFLFICTFSFILCFMCSFFLFFFFNATATTEIYTLSLHDALPIFPSADWAPLADLKVGPEAAPIPDDIAVRSTSRSRAAMSSDRKSTRLNSSHVAISYAVFCLKKKKKKKKTHTHTTKKMKVRLQYI